MRSVLLGNRFSFVSVGLENYNVLSNLPGEFFLKDTILCKYMGIHPDITIL